MPELKYTISETKLAEFKLGFLKIYPVPEGETMSENEWIKARCKELIFNAYRRGKGMLAREQLEITYDNEVIQ